MTGIEPQKRDYSGIEEIAEDVVGFNFRSFRTFGDLIVRPQRVFRAYIERTPDTYTPALRLWLGLLIILGIITYFFGGNDELIINAMERWPEAQRDAILGNIDGTAQDFGREYNTAFSFLQPLIIAPLNTLTVFLTAAYKRGVSWVARINISFAVLTVGSIVGLAAFPLLVQRADLAFWTALPVMLAYWITMFRGSSGLLATTRTGQAVKATLFTLLTVFLVFVSGIITTIASLTYATLALQPPA